MNYDVIVIGAGMVGTSAAWHLQKNGSKVLLLDKKAPGSETSYGNAGLIQREAVHVHPFPRQLGELIRVLPNRAPDIRYRWRAVWQYQKALLKYWLSSSTNSVSKIEKEWSTLIEHSTSEHAPMIQSAGADNLLRKVGWIELHRSIDKLNTAITEAQHLAEKGIVFDVLDIEALKVLEPNLNTEHFIGAIHWKNSWQITHPGNLVKAYAADFQKMQGYFKQAEVTAITEVDSGWQVVADNQTYLSEHVVVATGAWSNELLKPLGYNLPLFPMRGYHQHFETTSNNTINHSLVDMDIGFVMGPMQQGIRITTGAEVTAIYTPKDFKQLDMVVDYAKQLLPLQTPVESEAWSGTRPCFPDMKPVISEAGNHDKLWLAFGHGHQGFTLGPITGRLIEEMIHNKPTLIDVEPFSSKRFL